VKVALYIGTHDKDDALTRIGWAATRAVQKGKFRSVTHVEAILEEHADWSVTIGSASLRDGGVRTKTVKLNPEHWLIFDVPSWDVERSKAWFVEHDGDKYDWRGAFVTWLPATWNRLFEWFCNDAIGASQRMVDSHIFGPSQFAAIVASFGCDVTQEFFNSRGQ
jgi:hypothetical protein